MFNPLYYAKIDFPVAKLSSIDIVLILCYNLTIAIWLKEALSENYERGDIMTFEQDGFYGTMEGFKKIIYSTFVRNGGMRSIDPNNVSRLLDDVCEYHIGTNEQVVQIILFYYCLSDVLGFLPAHCYDIVHRYIDEYKKIRSFERLTNDEQNHLKIITYDLISKIV